MICEMAPSFPAWVVANRGSSDAAGIIAIQLESARNLLQRSSSVGIAAKDTFYELYLVADESRFPNWDGYGAAPVEEETFWKAYSFLESLPFGNPLPSIGAEPDGHITLEWHRSARRTLSISVSPEGDLHYAALLGPSKAFGTEPFSEVVPKIILDLINRVCFI